MQSTWMYGYQHRQDGQRLRRHYEKGVCFQYLGRRCRQTVARHGLLFGNITLISQLVDPVKMAWPHCVAQVPTWTRHATPTTDVRNRVSRATELNAELCWMCKLVRLNVVDEEVLRCCDPHLARDTRTPMVILSVPASRD